MNIKRVLTTIIGLPIIIAILIFSNTLIVDLIVSVVACIAVYEYTKAASKETKIISWIPYLCAVSIIFLHNTAVVEKVSYIINSIGIPLVLMILFLHVIISNMKITFKDISYTLIGTLYIIGFIIFIPIIYGIEGDICGKVLIWYVFIAAWATDIFAYLVGKHFGKHKFSKVSPNKTIEGCTAGIVATIIISLIFTYFINLYMAYEISYIFVMVMSIILSVAGQVGDFSASVIKRHFDIKDYSNLFPGHGGMLDRIDSLMFIAPFAYFAFMLFLI